MKINISKQSIYLLSLSIFLLLFVLLFSFLVLIPKGKEYRIQRTALHKDTTEFRRYEEFSNSTLEKLKQLQSDNAHIITAFNTPFNSERFQKQHSLYFTSLELSKIEALENEEEFAVYEVNTTSSINSPKSFYDFLDAVNKGDWIIGINFPIDFKRDHELINSSFTMRVYNKEKISTK
nr:hypothetical protein [uncultured Sulfurimonas sp.]